MSTEFSPSQGVAQARGWAPFALGFRPFFLLAGAAAVVMMLLWLVLWHGLGNGYYGQTGWHSHEMLFGYAVAVIAGFLLTAVRNWTGIDTPTGRPLAALALLWLAGRLLPWLPAMPGWSLALVDLAFLPALAIALAGPLWRGKNRTNRVFVPLLLGMAVANLLVHLQHLGVADTAARGQALMIDLLLLLLVLVAGRVLPFFTRNVIPGFQPRTRAPLERASFAAMALLVVAGLLPLPAALAGALWMGFGGLQALRLAGWYERRIWRMPVLWVLHVGYAWLALGALLVGAAHFGLFLPSAALHALSAGAIGVFTLGMMARVALGHSGRSIDVSPAMAWAFGLLNLGVLLRVFGPAWLPQHYLSWIMIAGLLWILSFAVFVVIYVPILLRPRIDGRPG